MHNIMVTNDEMNMGFVELLKLRGATAAFTGLIAVAVWMLVNNYIMLTPLQGNQRYAYVVGYLLFVSYFTWKPRLVSLLRRGKK